MCRKYVVKNEVLSLNEILDNLAGRSTLPPKVIYGEREKATAHQVLTRLMEKTNKLPAAKNLEMIR